MESMKAVRIHSYGGRDVLAYEDSPLPTIGADELLIQVAATSVNPFDWAVRNGYVANFYTYTFPLILGLDASGVVVAVGDDVQGFQPGDEVFARANPAKNGAYAEYISVPSTMVAHKPRTVDHLHAAAVPHVALSAWISLFNVANLAPGQTVLISGAAGGVGSMAVQLAKRHGARVIGTASSKNQEYLRRLGADEAIDYNTTRFEDAVQDVDVVLDLVGDMGDNTQSRSWQTLKPGGVLVSMVQFPNPEAAAEHGVRGEFASSGEFDPKTLGAIGKLIDSGEIKLAISNVYKLDDIQAAHAQSEMRHLRGKIAVQVSDL
jgi:NADPH:quinone reductase-like Zn-dependent oxidoreductase